MNALGDFLWYAYGLVGSACPGAVPDAGFYYYAPITAYCTNTTNPDWNRNFVALTVPNMKYVYSSSFCTRANPTDLCSCPPQIITVPYGPVPPQQTSNCTKTGPQPN